MPDTDTTVDATRQPSSDDALQRALLALKDLRARAERAENAATEPIAIIGVGCRFPGGANSPEEYWELIRDGRDAMGRVPADRWEVDDYYDPDPDTPGKSYTDQGGFIDQPVDEFDAAFFGIAPVEAKDVDPQQRLLLEVTWEALEHAGIAPDGLVGSATGVFVGVSTSDYSQIMMREVDTAELGTYAGTGVANSVAAGRISHTLGLRGPTICLDTACSASLVSVAMAAQSLRSGACRTALAGGVNLMLDPQAMISLSMLSVLSRTGRCHTFGAGADGYARGEGAGMVVMKRLSDAQADGDPILAVVRAGAVNHDGRSSGLTVPSGAAQREVIKRALTEAGLDPADIDVIEAHGTGTDLGDPIEVRALDAVYSRGRPSDRPLLLGSVKTNIGHLEAAAGIAGLIKMILALQHEELPPHLHCDELSPHIEWSKMPVEVNRRLRPWTRTDRPRRAAISGFGWGGTNSHVIVEEAPAAVDERASDADDGGERPVLLALSARSDSALAELAGRTAQALDDGRDVRDLAWTLQDGRARFRRRLAVTATSGADAAERLRAWRPDADDAGTSTSDAAVRPRLAFVFTGQGAQLAHMGRDLYEHESVVRAVLDECDEVISPSLPHRLLDVMHGDGDLADLIHRTEYTQPAMFALQCGLAELWRSWGVTPDVVAGHSIGEYAAAVTSGVMDLTTGARLIAARGTLMGALPVGGEMVAVFAEEADVRELIAPHRSTLSVAAVNGPSNVVVSGDAGAIAELLDELQRRDVRFRRLEVSHAFHSPLMTPMISEFEAAAADVALSEPKVAFVSTVTGAAEKASFTEPTYWRDQVTSTVRFAEAIGSIVDSGVDQFLEIGPQPTLLGMIGRIRGSADGLHASMRPAPDERSDRERFVDALGSLWTGGIEPDWRAIDGGRSARVPAPTYPFQRQRYWISPSRRRSRSTERHPLLGETTRAPALGATIHETTIAADWPAWLGEHRVADHAVMPESALTEMVMATCDVGQHIETLNIHDALALRNDDDATVQTIVDEASDGRDVRIVSLDDDPGSATGFSLHATATVGRSAALAHTSERLDVASAIAAHDEEVDVHEHYARMESVGLDYGPTFRGLTRLLRRDGSSLGSIGLPDGTPDVARYRLHPAILDACFHVAGAALTDPNDDSDDMFVPLTLEGVRVVQNGVRSVWCSVRLLDESADELGSDSQATRIEVFDEHGDAVASVDRCVTRRVPKSQWAAALAPRGLGANLYELTWRPSALEERDGSHEPIGNWIVVSDDEAHAGAVAAGLGDGPNVAATTLVPFDPDGLDQLLDTHDGFASGQPVGVIVLCSHDASIEATVDPALQTAQALASRAATEARLWIVARGGQTVDGEPPSLAGAAAWGLARTIANEQPQLGCVCIDLDPSSGGDDVTDLVADALHATRDPRQDDDQIAFRNGRRFVARLNHHDLAAHSSPPAPYELALAERGSLDGFSFASSPLRSPGSGEIEIEVRATGLNFRDVLNVLGTYPGDAGSPGLECAGVVTAVGDDVAEYDVGDEVFGLAPHAFSSSTITTADLVVAKPDGISFAQAATLPIAQLTAAHGLDALADLERGQSILIHSAAGGVGMAALALAQRRGAEIFATAGSVAKREALRALGVEHVYDSRTLDFADQIREATDGHGVDVVLNALTDEFIGRSFDVLADDGTFLEIGKRGVWTSDQARAVRPNATYHAYDLSDLLAQDAAGIRAGLRTIAADVERGTLTPLPVRAFPIDEVGDAFRFMADARHIGKVVVTHGAAGPAIRDDGSYLVTGGLGGLGLVVASWLTEQGARHLVLAGRSDPSDDALVAIDAMRHAGATVEVVSADVSDAADVDHLIAAATAHGTRLRGVFHAAGVLDDGALAQQSWSRFAHVFAPKVTGAQHLDRATRTIDLDHFVLFSSVSGLLGSPGQANYAAANSALDALAHRRRSRGLAALSIDWGAWAEAGMAARLDEREHQRMSARGMGLLTNEVALEALGSLIEHSGAQVAVMSVDWPAMFATLGGEPPALLSELGSAAASTMPDDAPAPDSLVDALVAADPGERRTVTKMHVLDQAARVLGLESATDVPSDQNLADLGMDSLMAVEFTNRLRLSAGLTLEPTLIFEHPTADSVADHVLSRLERLVAVKAKLAAMSPEEVTAALAARRAASAETSGSGEDAQQ